MAVFRKLLLVFAMSVVACVGISCGRNRTENAGETQEKQQLAEIYELYAGAVKKNRKPPERLAVLNEFSAIYPTAMQQLQSGRYTVIWGTATGKGENAVLAYQTDAAEKGGAVLMADGTVKVMTASDLQAVLKTKG